MKNWQHAPPLFGNFNSNFSKKGGTRPPSPREVNSRGSSPAVGRFAPSGLPSLFPRFIEMIPSTQLWLRTTPTSLKACLSGCCTKHPACQAPVQLFHAIRKQPHKNGTMSPFSRKNGQHPYRHASRLPPPTTVRSFPRDLPLPSRLTVRAAGVGGCLQETRFSASRDRTSYREASGSSRRFWGRTGFPSSGGSRWKPRRKTTASGRVCMM